MHHNLSLMLESVSFSFDVCTTLWGPIVGVKQLDVRAQSWILFCSTRNLNVHRVALLFFVRDLSTFSFAFFRFLISSSQSFSIFFCTSTMPSNLLGGPLSSIAKCWIATTLPEKSSLRQHHKKCSLPNLWRNRWYSSTGTYSDPVFANKRVVLP